MVKKFINNFKELEINQTNEHIRDNLSHLNFKSKIKFYSFYAATITAGFLIYNSVNSIIQKDEFRHKIITQNNVSPIISLTYSTYSSDLEELQNQLQNLDKKAEKVPSKYGQSVKTLKMKEWAKSLKNRDEIIENSKIYKEYLVRYFVKYMLNNMSDTIELNSKNYSYMQISKKLNSLDPKIAQKAVQKPYEALVTRTQTLDFKQQEAAKEALFRLAKMAKFSSGMNFYKNINVSLKNAKDDVAKQLFSQSNFFTFSSKYRQERVKIERPIELKKAYREYRKAQQQKRIELRKQYEKEKAKYDKQLKAIQTQKIAIQTAIQKIKKLQQDPSNYDANQIEVEDALKKVKNLSKGN